MRGNLIDRQTLFVDDPRLGRIQIDRQIFHHKFFVRAKCLLIGESPAIADQQIDKSRCLRKKSRAIWPKNPIRNRPIGGQSSCVEKRRQVSRMIDVQMRQQNRIHLRQI